MSQTSSIRWPDGMLDRIDAAAADAGMKRNAFVVAAVQRSISDPLPDHETKLNSRPEIVEALDNAREHPEQLSPRSRPPRGRSTRPAQVVEIESRPVAGMHQWRVKGEDQPMGTVPYRREIEADARRKLAERFGHPVEVRHK